MQLPDLNLLPALDALLRTGSVTGAAREMAVSASAMSRTLSRLRRVVGDPLLVPSGRGLALTPRAVELRPVVEAALAGALGALAPPGPTDIASVDREFTLRCNDSLVVAIGPDLLAVVAERAPGVRLRFLPEGDEDPADLRGPVDLDVSSVGDLPPDVVSRALPAHGYVAVARPTRGPMTPAEFAAVPHVGMSRRGRARSVVDDALAALGLTRTVLATAATPGTACALAASADALALIPAPAAVRLAEAMNLAVLPIPLDLPWVEMAMSWHLRVHTDPAHRWLRERVADAAGQVHFGLGHEK